MFNGRLLLSGAVDAADWSLVVIASPPPFASYQGLYSLSQEAGNKQFLMLKISGITRRYLPAAASVDVSEAD
jgi:hypothetical protein